MSQHTNTNNEVMEASFSNNQQMVVSELTTLNTPLAMAIAQENLIIGGEDDSGKSLIPTLVGDVLSQRVRRPSLEGLKGRELMSIETVCGGGKTQLLIHNILPAVFKKNEKYWKGEGYPYTKDLEEIMIPIITEEGEIVGHRPYEGLTVLVASKTKALSSQSGEEFKEKYGYHRIHRKDGIESEVVDDRISNNVRGYVKEKIEEEYHGVLFITHSTLLNLVPPLLNKCIVFIDEIPEDLARYLHLEVKSNETSEFLNKWFDHIETSHSQFEGPVQSAIIKPSEFSKCGGAIMNAKMGYSVLSDTCIAILEQGYNGFDPIYKSRKKGVKVGNCMDFENADRVGGDDVEDSVEDRSPTVDFYQTLSTNNLHNVIAYPRKSFILAANVRDTLPGFITEEVFKVPLIQIHKDKLPQKHKVKAVVYPLLNSGKYSSAVKSRVAKDCLINSDGSPYTGKGFVLDAGWKWAKDVLDKESDAKGGILLFKNKMDQAPKWAYTEDGHDVVGTQVHGMNSWLAYEKSVFLGTLLPDSHTRRALGFYAKDMGIEPKKLIDKLVLQRSHEACYQCVFRDAKRLASYKGIAHFIVPDMSYVDYIKATFDVGYLRINTKNSFKLKLGRVDDDHSNKLRTFEAVEFMKNNKAKPKAERMTEKETEAYLKETWNIGSEKLRLDKIKWGYELFEAGLIKSIPKKSIKREGIDGTGIDGMGIEEPSRPANKKIVGA